MREQKYSKGYFDFNINFVTKEAGIFISLFTSLSFPSKYIIQKFLCDIENDYVQVLSSQYLGKCTHKVTVLLCILILCRVLSRTPDIRAQ